MKTTINKTFQVEDAVDRVWDLLSNPEKIVVCVPGASLTEKIDENNFKGAVSLKFGPVKASYDGKIVIEERDDVNHQMRLKGKGLDSKGKGSADMVMNGKAYEKDGGSEVDFSMEVSVTGKLAQFGSRLITDVSNQLFDQFVANFKKKLAETPVAATPVAAAPVTQSHVPTPEKSHLPQAESTSTHTAPPPAAPAPQEDNSVNAFSILWGLIKSFFSRLFGGGKG